MTVLQYWGSVPPVDSKGVKGPNTNSWPHHWAEDDSL